MFDAFSASAVKGGRRPTRIVLKGESDSGVDGFDIEFCAVVFVYSSYCREELSRYSESLVVWQDDESMDSDAIDYSFSEEGEG